MGARYASYPTTSLGDALGIFCFQGRLYTYVFRNIGQTRFYSDAYAGVKYQGSISENSRKRSGSRSLFPERQRLLRGVLLQPTGAGNALLI